jgi:hypothetical protein
VRRRLEHELAEPDIGACIERLQRLARQAPRKTPYTIMDTYLLYWASFKRRVAEAAAECIIRLVPGVKEVYYTDLSEDYAGRDIDLVIVADIDQVHERELEETIEAILAKLAEAAGVRIQGLTSAPSLFEVHLRDSLMGSRSRLILLARSREAG